MTGTRERPGASNAGAEVSQGGDRQSHYNRPCPPGCATACAVAPQWLRALHAEHVADPATRTVWALAGLWGPADPADVLPAAAGAFGRQTVAEALETAARWPSAVGIDATTARSLAASWREGVAA